MTTGSTGLDLRNSSRRALRLVREPRRLAAGLRNRLGSSVTTQRFRLVTADLDLEGDGLEIGPSHNPLLPKSSGYKVRTADHLDQPGLRAKYEGLRPIERIESVDYVLRPGRIKDSIPDSFDYIVASHVMEHTACVVAFLQDCQTLLRPGGVLSLALPDKRYCFDRFRERTSLGRIIDVYRANPQVHSEGSVIEHNLYNVGKHDKPYWSKGAVGRYRFRYTTADALARGTLAADGQYVDTHNWVLTPHHFRLLLADLHDLGLVALRENSFHDTVGHEFFITLSADAAGPALDRRQLVKLADREARVRGRISFA